MLNEDDSISQGAQKSCVECGSEILKNGWRKICRIFRHPDERDAAVLYVCKSGVMGHAFRRTALFAACRQPAGK